jgi:hypothetical protein
VQPPSPSARALFFGIVLAGLAGAVVASIAQDTPRDLPDYALNSAAVYHIEIALVLFVAVYAAIAAVWLAYQGRAFTKLTGPGGIGAEAEPLTEAIQAVTNLEAQVGEPLVTAVEDLEQRVSNLERF